MGQAHVFSKDMVPDMNMLRPSWGSLSSNFAFVTSLRTSMPKQEESPWGAISEMRCHTLLRPEVYGFPLVVHEERSHQIRLFVKFSSG